jgi:hypothetical protein
MAALLASNQDVNAWFTNDKLEADDANTAGLQIEAWRLIRGQLANSYLPTVLASWVDPETTPDQIRSIASRLIAAYLYRAVYAEDSLTIPPYAQQLYNEAIQMLADVRSGNVVLLDVNDEPIATNISAMSASDFWPNNTTDGPFFTMDAVFG